MEFEQVPRERGSCVLYIYLLKLFMCCSLHSSCKCIFAMYMFSCKCVCVWNFSREVKLVPALHLLKIFDMVFNFWYLAFDFWNHVLGFCSWILLAFDIWYLDIELWYLEIFSTDSTSILENS